MNGEREERSSLCYQADIVSETGKHGFVAQKGPIATIFYEGVASV